MVLHKCNICQYETIYPTNYKNHLKSVKHMRNVEKYNKEKPEKYCKSTENSLKLTVNKNKLFQCKYCPKQFSRKDNLNVHIKQSCKVKKELDEEKRKEEQKKEEKDIVVNKLLEEITKMREEQKKKEEEHKELREEIEKLKSNQNGANTTNNSHNTNTTNNSHNTNTTNNSHNTNTTNNTNITNNNIKQNIQLNMNFQNVIPMETFLYNMEHNYLIPEHDIEAILYANDNLKIDDVADRIVKTLIANCKRQVKDMKIDNKKVLPILPVVSTDCNLRSHRERLINGWDTLYDDDYLEKMLSIINDRMCDLKRRVIFISKKHKNKVFSRIKKKTSMSKLINLQNEINGENLE